MTAVEFDTSSTEDSRFQRLANSLRTVVSIPVTPYASDGAIDEAAYAGVLRRLTDGGVSVVTVNGNTGEFYALSQAERQRLVRLTRDEVPASTTVMAGVGLDVATAVADAQAAVADGADCVMVHHPVHPFRSPQGWVDYHRRIAEEIPGIGVVPYLKDAAIGPAELCQLIQACAGVVAVKYAVADPARMAHLAAALPELTWLCGLAEIWAPFFSVAGASGFTSGLVTIDPARSLRMLTALGQGDVNAAMAEWRALRAFEHLRARRGSEHNVSAVKEALAQLGVCDRRVRPPITELDPAERAEVSTILTSWSLAPSTV